MDSKQYFHSLAGEITAVKDRVQNLIGSAHWPTVGAWKESVLRSILRRHLPPSLQIASGFVLANNELSNQIDILIYDDCGPVLFRDGDLVIVTSDVVRAVIEVKTRIVRRKLEEILLKTESIAQFLRKHPVYPSPFFGIFSYDDKPRLDSKKLLITLKSVNGGVGKYPINCISIGRRQFVRFWDFPPKGQRRRYSMWHCYDLDGIAQAYFVHNLIDHLFPESINKNNDVWYPVDDKENRLVESIGKDD